MVDQLGLQRKRGGGHHDRPVDQQGGHQIGQRLAGTGAGLDEQVLAGLRGPGDGTGHRLLAGPGDAARDGAHGGGEKLIDRGPATHGG